MLCVLIAMVVITLFARFVARLDWGLSVEVGLVLGLLIGCFAALNLTDQVPMVRITVGQEELLPLNPLAGEGTCYVFTDESSNYYVYQTAGEPYTVVDATRWDRIVTEDVEKPYVALETVDVDKNSRWLRLFTFGVIKYPVNAVTLYVPQGTVWVMDGK